MSRIKRHIFLIVGLLILAVLGLISPRARAANFSASLDRDTITLGETATLSLTFEGGQPNKLASLIVAGLQFGTPSRSFSQNIDFNSGQVNTRLVLTYSVTPQHDGEFTIPALAADVNGQQLTSQPLKLMVTKSSASPPAGADNGSQIAFAKLTLPQKQIYSGETITADLQLFYRQDTQLAREPQVTGEAADGFTVGKITGDNQGLVQIGNAVYNVIPAKIALTANKTGTLHIGPVTVELVLLVPSNDRETEQFFDPFGMLRRNTQKQLSVATDTLDMKSLPLPTENVPANFNGAVGDYQLTATVGPTNLAVGDPITLHVQISGRGDLGSVTLPDQTALHDFKIFAPTSKVESSDQLGMEGTKTFEEIVTPQNADVHEWPQFSFSFFNPADGKYHTLTQPAVPLAVHSVGATVMPAITSAKNSSPENQTPQDILPIKENLGTPELKNAPLIAQPKFLALQGLPVIAFLAALVWRQRTDSLANNPRLRRQRAVAQLVAGGLSDLNQFAAKNESREFFAMLFRLLQEQLGERLDCPATAITEADVDQRLILLGASPAMLESLRELFQFCNQARYAPIQTRQELVTVTAKFKKVVGELQSLKP